MANGLPATKTTTTGLPVAHTERMSCSCAPVREISLRSIPSPLVEGSLLWRTNAVLELPTNTRAISLLRTALTASVISVVSIDANEHPFA